MTRRTFDLPEHLDEPVSGGQVEKERTVRAEVLRAAVEVGLTDVRAGRVTAVADGGISEYVAGLLDRARAAACP
ncbi:hypothetical protein [Caenispirillum bisanense]|uniref:Uncharacterized protein n=1 Tax=Caenispirillum bisanense TaxID=414052 RepID=A0A286GK06_9PROT|nr:hypothetical protein [Caenispirillum bisanense]SOD95871.1 hypothetical protein SAMN05421508_10538 [Caenispirillum bisanense]